MTGQLYVWQGTVHLGAMSITVHHQTWQVWCLAGHAAPDGALTREHTRPSPAAAQVGQAEEAKAKQGREAQQEELVKRTGDTLYPPSGSALSWGLLPCPACPLTIVFQGHRATKGCWLACMWPFYLEISLGCPKFFPLIHISSTDKLWILPSRGRPSRK